jgi:hypothetical protein
VRDVAEKEETASPNKETAYPYIEIADAQPQGGSPGHPVGLAQQRREKGRTDDGEEIGVPVSIRESQGPPEKWAKTLSLKVLHRK